MPSPVPFDATVYMVAPIITIGSGIILGRALLDASPKSMPTNVKKAAKKLKTTVDTAEDAWVARQRELGVVTDEDSRAFDTFTDNLWGALRSRLLAYSALPSEDFPKAPRATELVFVLFGAEGLNFLKAKYPIQLSSMATLLKPRCGYPSFASAAQFRGDLDQRRSRGGMVISTPARTVSGNRSSGGGLTALVVGPWAPPSALPSRALTEKPRDGP